METHMKNFFEILFNFFEAVGTAKAAAELSRQGRFDEAKALMSSKS
jgi:hypothetical protein